MVPLRSFFSVCMNEVTQVVRGIGQMACDLSPLGPDVVLGSARRRFFGVLGVFEILRWRKSFKFSAKRFLTIQKLFQPAGHCERPSCHSSISFAVRFKV